ncbi:protein NETWORKED 4B [Trifolium repens]|nr:protein NETWORKED 4B [Trifolium repens]
MEDSSNSNVGCNRENVLVTPYQKQMLMKSELQTLNINLLPSTDSDNSSVASMYEDCESPLSSWDSEPETDIISLEENYLDMEEQNSDDGLLWEMDNRSYEELLKKFIEKEEELRVSNFKLQLSEQEIIKLNVQVENSEVQLDSVCEELNLKQKELQKLKSKMLDSQAKFCLEKDELKRELTSKLEDCDSRNKELENKLSQYKLEEEELHASQQKFFEDEIESLMEEQGQRMDMLMIELEKANNMIDYLKAEICSRDDKISNMKKFTDDVKTSLKELIIEVYNLKLGMGGD